MGAEIALRRGVTLQANAPLHSNLRLIRHGEIIAQAQNSVNLTHTVTRTGAYRIEATIRFKARRRGWIYSNPIYVQPD